MTAEPAVPAQPPHPLPALTTYELTRYRRQLEHALDTLPARSANRGMLSQRLAAVLAEQCSRGQIARPGR